MVNFAQLFFICMFIVVLSVLPFVLCGTFGVCCI